MDAAMRAGYLALFVLAIVLACLKLWWLTAACLICIGLTYLGIKMFEEPADW